jgi:hypothetical protein
MQLAICKWYEHHPSGTMPWIVYWGRVGTYHIGTPHILLPQRHCLGLNQRSQLTAFIISCMPHSPPISYLIWSHLVKSTNSGAHHSAISLSSSHFLSQRSKYSLQYIVLYRPILSTDFQKIVRVRGPMLPSSPANASFLRLGVVGPRPTPKL